MKVPNAQPNPFPNTAITDVNNIPRVVGAC